MSRELESPRGGEEFIETALNLPVPRSLAAPFSPKRPKKLKPAVNGLRPKPAIRFTQPACVADREARRIRST